MLQSEKRSDSRKAIAFLRKKIWRQGWDLLKTDTEDETSSIFPVVILNKQNIFIHGEGIKCSQSN